MANQNRQPFALSCVLDGLIVMQKRYRSNKIRRPISAVKTITACLLVLVAIVLFPANAAFGQGNKLRASRLRHEEAIRQVLARFEMAFEKRDAGICSMSFVDDADWENDFGSREIGRVNIERRLAAIYGVITQLRQQIVELRIRFITDDVAVADVDREIFEHVSFDVVRNPARKVRTTHVFKRKKGNWQVVVFRMAELRNL